MELETAEKIIDTMYQQRIKRNEIELGFGTLIDLSKEIEFTSIETAAVILLREEIRANKKLERIIAKIKEYRDKFIEDSENETTFITQSAQINAVLIDFCNELLKEE